MTNDECDCYILQVYLQCKSWPKELASGYIKINCPVCVVTLTCKMFLLLIKKHLGCIWEKYSLAISSYKNIF